MRWKRQASDMAPGCEKGDGDGQALPPPLMPVQFDRTFRIGDAARFLGISPQSLRDYEDLGVVAPDRSAGGTRSYGFSDLSTLESLRMWRQMGVSLPDAVRLVKGEGDASIVQGLIECQERYERSSVRLQNCIGRIRYMRHMMEQAPQFGLTVRRGRMAPMLLLALVHGGQPIADERLDALTNAWLEQSPCVFYVNIFENLKCPVSTWAGLGIHVDDIVGWNPYQGTDGLVHKFDGGRAVHGFGWHDSADTVWHDVAELDRKAPLWLRGRPQTLFAESLLANNADGGQRIFWSKWLTY